MSVDSLHNICVFIKDEAQLEEALSVLIENNQQIGSHFYLSDAKVVNYLFYSKEEGWNLSFKTAPCITLTELEQMLKDVK